MAKIVLSLGSSHGPTMRTPADQWLALGEKDREDPRFDYEAALRLAPPNMEAQLSLETRTERADACKSGIGALGQILAEAKADTVVVLSNLHGEIPDYAQQIFGVYVGDSLPKSEGRRGEGRPGYVWAGRDRGEASSRGEGPEPAEGGTYPADSALARYLHERLQEVGFDIACGTQFRPNSGLGDAFTSLYSLYRPEGDIPMVPFMISRYLPNEPTPRRCYELGQALREAVEAWDAEKRVVLMASGGLSHQIVDEELDRSVIEALLEKDVNKLWSIPRDRLNHAPGTPETLNWVAVAGAMEDVPMTLVDYVPCYRSMAGTGHGVTFAYWR